MKNTRIVYINGKYYPAAKAKISVFDRGLLFADSVYEVIAVYSSHTFFIERHLQRLTQNLEKININVPEHNWREIFSELIKRNGGGDLQIYLQITRGTQDYRSHDIVTSIQPTVIAFTIHKAYPKFSSKQQGLRVTITRDLRWLRCDIKSTALLANILANNVATACDADTAIFARDGFLTEGISSNLFIVNSTGEVLTPIADNYCLPGITRQLTLELINTLKWPIKEEKIPIATLYQAREIWITSTTKEIYPVTAIDHTIIGDGYGGLFWQEINDKFQQLKLTKLHGGYASHGLGNENEGEPKICQR